MSLQPLSDKLRNKKILIVEDEPSILEVLTVFLEDAGYNVSGVGSGREMRRHLKNSIPDCIMLDYLLAGENDVELVHSLKETEATKSIPIILMSAALELIHKKPDGINDYLSKPFNLEDMVRKVEKLVQHK